MMRLTRRPLCQRAIHPYKARRYRNGLLRCALSLILTIALLLPTLTASARSSAGSTDTATVNAQSSTLVASILELPKNLLRVIIGNNQSDGMPAPEKPEPEKIAPSRPPSKAKREAKAVHLELNPAGEVVMERGETMIMTAIPLDAEENAVHGLVAEWTSDRPEVVSITTEGEALAVGLGDATLSAQAGQKIDFLKVTVIASTGKFGDNKQSDSVPATAAAARQHRPVKFLNAVWSPADREAARPRLSRLRSSSSARPRFVRAAMPLRQDNYDDPLPDSQSETLYQPTNEIGAPPGRTEMGAPVSSPAAAGTETPGSSNFSFTVPIMNLPGRGGVDDSLGLIYNSRVWHKSTTSGGATLLTYDVDNGWPGVGFKLGYGQIETQGTNGYTLTDRDGTRHKLVQISTGIYETIDGTFTRFIPETGGGKLTYPDATQVQYGAAGGGIRIYPTRITDRNGNYLLINYRQNTSTGPAIGPRVASLQDTLGRFVRFNYTTSYGSGDLVAITVPGYAGGADRQAIRFYYEDLTINPAGSFTVSTSPAGASTTRVLRYVFFPGTNTGYKYEYSTYGMIFRLTKFHGMAVSTTALNATGAVTNVGQSAAESEYNYQRVASSLSNAPTYTERNDPWAGQTSARPIYIFGNPAAGVTTVTAPDGSVTETRTIVNAGQWNDGLVSETSVKKSDGTLMARTVITWEDDGSLRNPRPQQLQITNEANQTRSIVYTYTSYNNVSVVSERGFDGAEMRRTETTYETGANWTNRRLLRLPKSVKVFAGGAATPRGKVEHLYDEAGTVLTACPGIIMYTDPATTYRGNVTSIKRFADAASATPAQTDTISYDVAGNARSATADCCRQKQWIYNSTHYYAYLHQEKKGDSGQLTTEFSYDFNTGLGRSVKDVDNNTTTTLHYWPETLRHYQTVHPNGGYTQTEYGDDLYDDPDATRRHSWVKTTAALDASRSVHSYQFFDGRGATARTFAGTTNNYATVDVEYDIMGRVLRSSSQPYFTAGALDAVNPTGLWTTAQYDALGRPTSVTQPGSNAVQTTYAGTAVTLTDQAGKQRRTLTDALGRVIRLDEPDGAGNLGTTAVPVQPTSYLYDALDNLIKVTQGVQNRYFKYDSLGRLTYERHVEQDAPHTATDSLTGNGSWSSRVVYDSLGRVSESFDARNIRTGYGYDGLNRVTQKSFSDGTPTVTYEFDEPRPGYYNRGRLSAVVTAAVGATPSTSQAYDYNLMGELIRSRQNIGSTLYTMNYSYNLLGELATASYPSGRVVTNSYDSRARLSSVVDATRTYASGLQYEEFGGLKSETLNTTSAAVRTITYNSRLQPSQIKLTVGGAEKQRWNYEYGTVNGSTGSVNTAQNTGQVGRIEGSIDNARQWQQRIQYDKLGRMFQADEYRGDNLSTQLWRARYDFDRYGNRYQNTGAGYSFGIPFTPVAGADIGESRNRYDNITGITYDANGNITVDPKFRAMQYQYDANDRVQWSARTDGTDAVTAVYDGQGQRVQTTSYGATRHVVYDIFGEVVAEYDGGALGREYIYRGGERIALVESDNSVRYYVNDQQGSARVVLTASGSMYARRDYLPFGEEIAVGTGMRTVAQGYGSMEGTRQRYAGLERDLATGVDHTLWRKYDSASGRWTSPDPYQGSMTMADPQSFNRYAYVGNDPVNFTDPTGLFKQTMPPPMVVCRTEMTYAGPITYCGGQQVGGPAFTPNIPQPPGGGGGGTGPVVDVGEPPSPDCIANAVAGGTLGTTRGLIPAVSAASGKPVPTGRAAHDGVHVYAPPGGASVTALPAMAGRILHSGRQATSGGDYNLALVDILLNAPISGQQYVMTLKDLNYNTAQLRGTVRPGSVIGSVNGSANLALETGLHVTLMPKSVYDRHIGKTPSSAARDSVPFNSLMDAGRNPASPFGCP